MPQQIWGQVCLSFLAFSAICRAVFARHYLLTPGEAPWLNRAFRLFCGLFGIFAAGSWHYPLRQAVIAGFGVLGVGFPFVLATAGVVRWREGFEPAKFFLAPYIFTGIGAVAMGLTPGQFIRQA